MTKLELLQVAVRTAIAKGCKRSEISVPAWASTYRVSQREVRETWHSELTKETNAATTGGEGK